MRYFQSVEEILEFAAALEENTKTLANLISKRAISEDIRKMSQQFFIREDEHINTLDSIKQSTELMSLHKAIGLKIADYSVFSDSPDYENMKYKDILSIAIKNETACLKLYTRLAKLSTDRIISEQLLALAEEEALHRHVIQKEYDNNVRNT